MPAVEITFDLVNAPTMTCFSVWIELSTTLGLGSKLTWSLCGWSKMICLVRGSIDLVFTGVVQITWFMCAHRKIT